MEPGCTCQQRVRARLQYWIDWANSSMENVSMTCSMVAACVVLTAALVMLSEQILKATSERRQYEVEMEEKELVEQAPEPIVDEWLKPRELTSAQKRFRGIDQPDGGKGGQLYRL